MPFSEFTTLLEGLNTDTPLGHVVSVRAETDPKRIKEFSKADKKIHNEWKKRKAKVIDRKEYDAAMRGIANMFRSMAGGE